MRVTLKLYASLTPLLPEGAADHAATIEVPEETTPAQILERYRVPQALAHLVLVNGVYIEPGHRPLTRLREGDVLAVWPAVAGGWATRP